MTPECLSSLRSSPRLHSALWTPQAASQPAKDKDPSQLQDVPITGTGAWTAQQSYSWVLRPPWPCACNAPCGSRRAPVARAVPELTMCLWGGDLCSARREPGAEP